MRLYIATEPSEDDKAAVLAGLLSFSDNASSPREFKEFCIALKTERGHVVGGVVGAKTWNWLHIRALWISEEHRAKNFGKELLARAEETARALGCDRVRLDTFDFEAKDFYVKQGYAVYAALNDFPEGHTQYHMTKLL